MKAIWFRALVTLTVLLLPAAFFGIRWGWNTPLRDVKHDSPGTMIAILAVSVICAFVAGFYFVRALDAQDDPETKQ